MFKYCIQKNIFKKIISSFKNLKYFIMFWMASLSSSATIHIHHVHTPDEHVHTRPLEGSLPGVGKRTKLA